MGWQQITMRCEVGRNEKRHRGESGYSKVYIGRRAWGELDVGNPGVLRVGGVCGGWLMINYSITNEGRECGTEPRMGGKDC